MKFLISFLTIILASASIAWYNNHKTNTNQDVCVYTIDGDDGEIEALLKKWNN